MATTNPQVGVDRSTIPYDTQWLDVKEGSSGVWLPIGEVRGYTFNPGQDSVSNEFGLERRETKSRTAGGANAFTVDTDIKLGDPIIARMQALRDSGGNNHRLRLIQGGFKARGVTLSASKKIKVDKVNATGGNRLGTVTLTGIDLDDLGGYVAQGMCLALKNAAGTLTNLFYVAAVDYTKDMTDQGFLEVYEYSITSGEEDADPTLAEVTAGTLDHIFPEVMVEINASLDQDVRPNISPGQSARGSIAFSENQAPNYLVGDIGTYSKQDAVI